VKANYDIGMEDISVIMYVGSEFSRLIFLKGKNFLHFAPVISEGRTSPNIENTLYSRILLEQDSAGIMRLDRIFLAGESHKLELKQFLAPQFAEAPIEYLVPRNLDTGALQQSVEEITSEYAVPISVAMRVLDPKNPDYYSIDLLPQSFREGQKVFKLAWHGYLLMLLIFMGTLFFTTRVANLAEDVRAANRELQAKQLQQSENERLQKILDSLTVQNQQFISALEVYDNIVPNYNRWSKVFYHLTRSVEDVNSIWIGDILTKPDSTIELTGYTLYRPRIPRIANMFEKATLQSVELQEIRGTTVYKFILTIQKLDSD
jgi:DNA-binding ferritin-like protein (Dps family)